MVQDLPLPPRNVDYFAVCIRLAVDATGVSRARVRVESSPLKEPSFE